MVGFSGGLALAAFIAVKINELPLPFIDTPTRHESFSDTTIKQREATDLINFQNILKDNTQTLFGEPTDDVAATDAAPTQMFYYLQTGAFASEESAEAMRAELILQEGVEVRISAATLADDSTLYRVWVGPFEEEVAAEEKRALLALQGYNSSLLGIRESQ